MWLAYGADAVFVHRLTFPRLYVRVLSILVPRLVYDIDDALYASPGWQDDHDTERQEKVRPMLEQSDVVTAGSPNIAEFASGYAPDAYFIPTPFPREKYREAREKRGSKTGTVTMGWIGYPENLRYLATIEEELTKLLSEYDELRLVVITAGSLPVEPLAERKGDDVEYREWSLQKEVEFLSEADIGIRPLVDEPWTRGKAHGSVVQYMALGLPVVVTPVGLLSDLVIDGYSGFHATSSEEWIESITRLLSDTDLRAEMGEHAVERLEEERFWDDQFATELMAILEGEATENLRQRYPRFDENGSTTGTK